MDFQLTQGILPRLIGAQPGEDDLWSSEPTLQFLSIKKLTNAQPSNVPDRYRIIISDGKHFTQAMLASQLNSYITDDIIGKYTVAKIDKLTCNVVQSKRLLIILGITVLGQATERIGDPTSLDNLNQTEGQSPTSGLSPAPMNVAPQTGPTTLPQKMVQQPTVQRPPAASSNRPTVCPIEGLSPYSNKWTIKARVVQKSDVRTWSNAKGEGKLFNVTLMDESGEIRGTGFNAAVDELYDKFVEGKVYYISKARVNLAKKKFSNLSNEYELSLERGTEIEECLDQTNVPTVKYNFVNLSDLEQVPKDSMCDVIGVVKDVSDVSEIISKATSRPILKRELTVVDRSGFSVRLTLWGKQAEQYSAEERPVIAFKGVKVGDFGGRSLSMVSTSIMNTNPDIPEAHGLRGWFDAAGSAANFQSHSNALPSGGMSINRSEMRTLVDVKESQLGQSDKPEYFSARATIVHIKSDNISYPACPTEGCNKKVVEGNEGWRCEKCDRSYTGPEHRYIMSMSVADYTGQAWFQGFNDVGLAVFGMPANELVQLKERDEAKYNVVMHKANCNTFNFNCRAKQDTYNEQTRVRYGITRIQALDFRAEAAALRDLLHSEWAK